MKQELENQLNRILKKPRFRPLVRCENHNGKKCYVHKGSESYFQTLKKHPRPWYYWLVRPLKKGPIKFRFFGASS